jgi:hypothetical protein
VQNITFEHFALVRKDRGVGAEAGTGTASFYAPPARKNDAGPVLALTFYS